MKVLSIDNTDAIKTLAQSLLQSFPSQISVNRPKKKSYLNHLPVISYVFLKKKSSWSECAKQQTLKLQIFLVQWKSNTNLLQSNWQKITQQHKFTQLGTWARTSEIKRAKFWTPWWYTNQFEYTVLQNVFEVYLSLCQKSERKIVGFVTKHVL